VSALEFTGERFIPGTPGEIWLEHWHRYHFASRWVAGLRVLDVACGEGYGSALLARTAAHVTGVDISPQAIAHAQDAYAALANATFTCASCTQLPIPDASIDVAVSFETLEHIHEQEAFLAELARVLKPGGVLLISCPNKREYSDNRGFVNEHHVRELYREQLAALVGAHFPHTTWHAQRPTFYSVIAPEGGARADAGQLVELAQSRPAEAAGELANPLYYIVAAARTPEALAAVTPTVSVLSDLDDYLYRDYAKVIRELRELAGLRAHLEGIVAQRDADIVAIHERVRALEATLAQRETELARVIGELHSERARLEHEVLRRQGWRWWLRLPLVRLGWLAP
jgi:ubiquinone/menaquinone biosynthesis C-methylase UbiE